MSNDPLYTDTEFLKTLQAYTFFKTPAGIRVLDDIKSSVGYNRNVFKSLPSGGYDPIDAALRDGGRWVVNLIEDRIRTEEKITQ